MTLSLTFVMAVHSFETKLGMDDGWFAFDWVSFFPVPPGGTPSQVTGVIIRV